MITSELISLISKTTGMSRKDIDELVRVLPKVVMEEISKGNRVRINKLGTFFKKDCGDKVMYNPRTEQKEVIHGYEKITFRISEILKKSIQEKKI